MAYTLTFGRSGHVEYMLDPREEIQLTTGTREDGPGIPVSKAQSAQICVNQHQIWESYGTPATLTFVQVRLQIATDFHAFR